MSALLGWIVAQYAKPRVAAVCVYAPENLSLPLDRVDIDRAKKEPTPTAVQAEAQLDAAIERNLALRTGAVTYSLVSLTEDDAPYLAQQESRLGKAGAITTADPAVASKAVFDQAVAMALGLLSGVGQMSEGLGKTQTLQRLEWEAIGRNKDELIRGLLAREDAVYQRLEYRRDNVETIFDQNLVLRGIASGYTPQLGEGERDSGIDLEQFQKKLGATVAALGPAAMSIGPSVSNLVDAIADRLRAPGQPSAPRPVPKKNGTTPKNETASEMEAGVERLIDSLPDDTAKSPHVAKLCGALARLSHRSIVRIACVFLALEDGPAILQAVLGSIEDKGQRDAVIAGLTGLYVPPSAGKETPPCSTTNGAGTHG